MDTTSQINLTKEGKVLLEAELKVLIEVERPQVIQDIKDARAQGDLSENAEFDAAREKQGTIEDRIKEIEAILLTASIISSRISTKKVVIGSNVTIKTDAGQVETYQIVGSLEADPFVNKISNTSPLGKALLNKNVGDKARVEVKKEYHIEILEIK